MTEQELIKQRKWCRAKWNGLGDDVFQQACVIALERYKSLDKVNQSLFSRICMEAARNLRRQSREVVTSYERYEMDTYDSICELCMGRLSCEHCDEHHLQSMLHGQLSLPFEFEIEKGGE
jgi:hypothetical protein